MMKAFIYAAGRATRLGPEFASRPKILIELGGKSLLEWHVVRLREVGVCDLTIVTGHKGQTIADELPELSSRHGIAMRVIHNPNYTEGSVLSLHVSLPDLVAAGATALLMDGDVLYPAEMLRRLLTSPHPSALLIDRNFSTDDDDPVLVPIRNGRPFDFVKRWQGKSEELGESIGFFKVAAPEIAVMAEATQRRLRGEGRLDSYDDVLRELVQAGRFGHEDVTGLPWTEVDFPKDVEYARRTVLPALTGQGAFTIEK